MKKEEEKKILVEKYHFLIFSLSFFLSLNILVLEKKERQRKKRAAMDSMQNQQQKLSKLAIQLQSSEDRQRYIKVIEMSNMIQCKLESLQEDTLFKSKSSRQIHLDRRASTWSLSQDILSHRSSAISDNTTIVAGSHCSDHYAFKPYHEIPIEGKYLHNISLDTAYSNCH